MKKLAILLLSSLTACASLPNSAALSQEIQNVQVIAKDVCAVVPQAIDIANLISAGSLVGAGVIANAICSAVAASGQAPPVAVAAMIQAHAAGASLPAKTKWTPRPIVVGGVTVHFN
jgi:hypothetical protein